MRNTKNSFSKTNSTNMPSILFICIIKCRNLKILSNMGRIEYIYKINTFNILVFQNKII